MDVVDAIKELLSSPLFTYPPEDMSAATLARAHVLLARIEKACADRKNEIRPAIIAAVQDSGLQTRSGSRKLVVEDASASCSRSLAKEPDFKQFTRALRDNDIDLREAYDEVVSLKFNPSKVEKLIELGYLAQEDLNSCLKEVERLTVRPTKKFDTEMA